MGNSESTSDPGAAQDNPGGATTALQEEIAALRSEVADLRQLLHLIAPTMALAEGSQEVTHVYLRRALAKLENTSTDRLWKERYLTGEFTSEVEGALDLMADKARERGLTDLAQHLEE